MRTEKMKTMVILGNGFDLDLGLNTSFKSFINDYRFKSLPETGFVKQINGENWCDLEGLFRTKLLQYAKTQSEALLQDICDSWMLIRNAWGLFLPERTELTKISIKKKSCAYAMLQNCSDMSKWYSFNYTSPFYLARLSEENKIHYVHGVFSPREYTPKGCMFLIPQNLIIGVDSCGMPQSILENARLNHIIKVKNHFYEDCGLVQRMYEADNIILFGHSLNITDSDYFKGFFNDICNGNIGNKDVYIVTFDAKSLLGIEKNLYSWGIEYKNLINSKCNIKPIYTSEGIWNFVFRQMLDLI